MHLPQTHEIIKLIRDVLTLFTNSLLITETNVPHEDNISYFGNGFDEASMVYQFPLPPLTLHSYLSGDATYLTQWMKKLEKTSSETTYFNFLASHDGIGLRPIENVLTAQEKERLVNHCISKGGKVNYRNLPNGTQTPYELNINYLDALSFEAESEDNIRRKFLSAQSILLSIVGVPAIYYHSLLGSNGDIEGMKKSGINRRINREKLNLSQLEDELKYKSSRRHYIFYQYLNLIDIRKKQSAFNPQSNQEVKDYDKRIVSFIRSSQTQSILVLVNVSKQSVSINIEHEGYDLISKTNVKKEIKLNPYQYMWIEIHK